MSNREGYGPVDTSKPAPSTLREQFEATTEKLKNMLAAAEGAGDTARIAKIRDIIANLVQATGKIQ